jgi:predicted PurR-regulated permease PerM
MPKATIQRFSFLALVISVTAAFVWLLLPYYGAILWAVILAILFDPLAHYFERKFRGHRGLAAALCVLACVCVVVVPGSIIIASLTREASNVYDRISAHELDPAAILDQVRNALPPYFVSALSILNLGSFAEIQASLTSFLGRTSQGIASGAVTLGQGAGQFLINLALMTYLLFFLFRDGAELAKAVRSASPLSDRHTDLVLERFTAVVKATVRGSIIVAVIQGVVAGTMFWIVGIEAVLLWTLLMTILSLLPAIGAALVWAPAVVYFFITGHYGKAIALFAVCAIANTAIDNFLRPPLVGKGVRLPDYAVLVATVGGLTSFGMNGLIIGPLIAALFVAVWSLFADDHLRT